MKEFEMICAVSLNGVIGNSETNSMPWHIPSDLKHFKEHTVGKTVIMGSNTFLSLGRKLPNRKNVVISRGGRNFPYEPDAAYDNLWAAVEQEENPVIIGGQSLFEQGLNQYGPYQLSRLHMTIILHNVEGDVYFPIKGSWMLADSVRSNIYKFDLESRSDKTDENDWSFEFATFNRINNEIPCESTRWPYYDEE
jgi:dihydrofolate reductase